MDNRVGNLLGLLGRAIRCVWRHKRASACGAVVTVVAGYTCLFVLVSCSTSPTAERFTLPDQDVLAYQSVAGGDAEGGRVLLVHGAPADAGAWDRLLDRPEEILAAEISAVDRIGYGNSTKRDELTLAGHAASLMPLLEGTNNRKPVVVGHSYGAPVALRLAVDAPDRVGAVVLVAGACDAYMKDSQGFRRAVDGGSALVPEPWARANRELLALTDENRAMEPLLGRVTCPVFIVHGTWDGVCPHDSTVAYLKDRLVNAAEVRVVSLDRAGHNLHLSHLDEVIEAINSAQGAE